MEIWKKVDGYDNYSVSSEGRVRNDKTLRILKAKRSKKGYMCVGLCRNGKMKSFRVHRLVGQAFLPNPENKECIDHINCIRDDNRVENLRWCSHKENMNNPLSRINNREAQKGKHSGKNHPSSRAVVAINIENSSITIEFSSMRQAQKDGFNYGTIWKCCNGERKSHKGYYWCYKKDYIKFLESLK